MAKLPVFTSMNKPITSDLELVLVVRLANKLNQLLTQLDNGALFPQVDARAREILQSTLNEAHTLAERIAKHLRDFQKKEPEFKINLHESALCKVVDRAKDLVDVLTDYQDELIARFNHDIRNRSWAVDVAEWFCRDVGMRFHIAVNPIDHSAIYSAESPKVVIDFNGQSIPCINRLVLCLDPSAHEVRIEAHTDLDYAKYSVKLVRVRDINVLNTTKTENGRVVLYSSYKQPQDQTTKELFRRLTGCLELIKSRICDVLLEEIT